MPPWKSLNCTTAIPTPTDLTSTFTLPAPPSSDLWETPTGTCVFTAPLLYQSMPLSAFKRARVTITADLVGAYAQGGLAMLIRGKDGIANANENAGTTAGGKWVKTGLEFLNGEVIVSTVGRDVWPDWSPGRVVGEEKVTVEMVREGFNLVVVEVKEEERRVLRELSWVFAGEGEKECWVGVYVANPVEDKELAVTFEGLVVEME